MRLDEFIKNTLVGISNGVFEANKEITGSEKLQGNLPFILYRYHESKSSSIDFDIAITVKAEGGGKAAGKFRLFVVDADLQGGGGISKENVSRVKFSVSVDQFIGYRRSSED